ncbi:hypothetical protein LSPH24S_04186 [Lysinibacillus sphaericus]
MVDRVLKHFGLDAVLVSRGERFQYSTVVKMCTYVKSKAKMYSL